MASRNSRRWGQFPRDARRIASAPEHRTQQYFEMHANRAIYSEGWVAAQRSGLLPWSPSDAIAATPAWELYDLNRDYSEANNVAAQHPEKLTQLKKRFDDEAVRNNVYPLDARVAGRQHPNPPPPGGRAFYTFYPGATHLFDAIAPVRGIAPTRSRRTSIFPRAARMVCWWRMEARHRGTRCT